MMCGRLRRVFLHSASSLVILAAAGLSSPAEAACYGGNQALPQEQVNGFLNDSSSLLASNPSAGPAMISRVRDLVASDPATLPAVLNLLQNANADQKAAIGTGLGQAATICLRTDQDFATRIQQAVAQSGSPETILAYTSTTGGVQTAAVGGAGVGSPGGVGGPVTGALSSGTGSGSLQQIGSFGTNTLATPGITNLGVDSNSALSRAATSVSP